MGISKVNNRGDVEIVVVSTYTTDRLPMDVSGTRRALRGGPAYYMGLAFDRLAFPYRVITGKTVDVEVIGEPGTEHYVIPPIPTIPLPTRIDADAVVLSPVMQEINPEELPSIGGMLALDLQGFVRRPGRPTTDMVEMDLSNLFRCAAVVKAADEELQHLTGNSRDVLEDLILVRTRGARGAIIRHKGHDHEILARTVEAPHTIGAGDTFLAAFIVALLGSKSPVESGEFAARFTEQTLQNRVVRTL